MMPERKAYLIAGEASGDLHGGNLAHALKQLEPGLRLRGWGGPNMERAGVQLDVHYEQTSFMGFSEVIKNLPAILKLFRLAKQQLDQFQPDFIVLIDYPGFNLRMAQWAHQKGFRVYYFIAPQVWAWKEKRVQQLKAYVDRLFVILPFEKEYFRKHGLEVSYFGHPLRQIIREFKAEREFRNNQKLGNQSIISLLPGSRKQEIHTMLPILLEAVKAECRYQIVIAGMKNHQGLYESILARSGTCARVVYDHTYDLLHQSRYALVTSGTATLETALFGVPLVVCYKGNWMSYWIARQLIKVKYISLVNLIADKKIVPEMIQGDCRPETVHAALKDLMDRRVRERVLYSLRELQKALDSSDTYKQVAAEMLAFKLKS